LPKIFSMEPNERIILKALELFTKSGIRLVTMDQIAEEVGMSKRTIYELFKDKDTLVLECLENMHRQQMEEIQEIVAGSENVIEALYRLGERGEKKKAMVNHLFFEDIRKLYPQIWDMMKKRARTGTDSFSYKILTQGIKEGIFSQDMNVEIVDIFFNYMMEILHKKDMFPENISDKELLRNIVVPYYLGISTDKGKQIIEKYIKLILT
jgi:TetR/AcrR family transcriptional regulator, cholesterol catabolism regulator